MGIKWKGALKVALSLALTAVAVTPMGTATAADSKKVVYVFNGDKVAKDSFKTFLTNKGYEFRGLRLRNVPEFEFWSYDLIVVADDTAIGYDSFASAPAAEKINRSRKPVLALGLGGAMALDEINPAIGYMNGANSSEEGFVKSLSNDSLWSAPYTIDNDLDQVYKVPTGVTAAWDGAGADGAMYFANTSWSSHHHPLVADVADDGQVTTLWGFSGSADEMTWKGRKVFINTVVRTMDLHQR